MSHLVPLPWVKPPITLNPGLRSSSTHVKAAKVRVAKGEALGAIVAAGTPKGIPGIELTLHYRVPDRRRRDADNLAATLKVCQDALVVAGVIHEDSWVTVPSATCRIHPPSARARPRTRAVARDYGAPVTVQHVIRTATTTPCALPENRHIFDEVINLTVRSRSDATESKRRRPWIQAAREVCGGCPELQQCLQVHGREYDLGVIAGATDAQREAFFGGRSA